MGGGGGVLSPLQHSALFQLLNQTVTVCLKWTDPLRHEGRENSTSGRTRTADTVSACGCVRGTELLLHASLLR